MKLNPPTSHPRRNNQLALTVAVISTFTMVTTCHVNAASAVAVGINSESGRVSYSYWKGNAPENDARKRALQQGATMGYTKLRVIGSTSKLGYGAVVWFETGHKTSDCAVAFGAGTPQQAITAALQRAKAAGGRYALVEAVWHDGSPNTRDLIKL